MNFMQTNYDGIYILYDCAIIILRDCHHLTNLCEHCYSQISADQSIKVKL